MHERKFDKGNGTFKTLPPIFKVRHPSVRNCKPCKCAGCLVGKMKKFSTKSSTTKPTSEIVLKENSIEPGDLIFSDQYESKIGGRRIGTYGKENQQDKLKGEISFMMLCRL